MDNKEQIIKCGQLWEREGIGGRLPALLLIMQSRGFATWDVYYMVGRGPMNTGTITSMATWTIRDNWDIVV